MGAKVKPIAKIGAQEYRLPEQGRIRFGIKDPVKGFPKATDTFRFTSPDRQAIEQVAAVYGGEVRAWDEPRANQRNQWQVLTRADEIDVWIPPDSMSVGYELWTGGGRTRLCDGEQVVLSLPSPDGVEERVSPCICSAKQLMECKPKTRLTVILPKVRFGGGWRLETGSWAAFHEMPTMEQMLQALQANGLVVAKLALVERRKQQGKQVKRWKVPVLRLGVSPEEIVSGAASVAALTRGDVETMVALPSAEPQVVTMAQQADDEIIEAEVVEEERSWATTAEIPDEVKRSGVVKRDGRYYPKA